MKVPLVNCWMLPSAAAHLPMALALLVLEEY
jgi:hypothetical protein